MNTIEALNILYIETALKKHQEVLKSQKVLSDFTCRDFKFSNVTKNTNNTMERQYQFASRCEMRIIVNKVISF